MTTDLFLAEQWDPSVPVAPFITYLNLLEKWNKAYNLTAIRSRESMISHHLLDSLAIRPWIKGPRVIDVGTGAGFPGVPLAIAMPHIHVVLLDSNGKKIRFLREVKRVLALTNIEIVQSRVEAYHPSSGFDTVTSRALSDCETLVGWTGHLIADSGIWLAMKGRSPDAEVFALKHPYHIEPYTVNGLEGERCCVIIKNQT